MELVSKPLDCIVFLCSGPGTDFGSNAESMSDLELPVP